jgi:hypothetical protein
MRFIVTKPGFQPAIVRKRFEVVKVYVVRPRYDQMYVMPLRCTVLLNRKNLQPLTISGETVPKNALIQTIHEVSKVFWRPSIIDPLIRTDLFLKESPSNGVFEANVIQKV